MQVSKINSWTSFGQIYLAKGNYTDKQKNVINQIKETLRKPSEKFGSRTAEDFYKSEYNIDFFMSNGIECPNSIHLAGVWGLKHIGTGVNEMVQYGDSYGIGIYDEAHPFKTDDIEISHKEHRKNSWASLTFAAGILALEILGLALVYGTRKSGKTQELAKPLIENVDSLANKVKTTQPDTTKIIEFVRK